MSIIAPLSLHSFSTMSKDNMLLGHARGKVGSLVFARRAGVQITRAYNANPANPRTVGQSAQRMLMSTAIQAYRNMSAIVDHSYEGAVGKAGNMREFMKEALKNLRSDHSQFAYQFYGQTKFYPGNYLIARGSLTPLPNVNKALNSGNVVLSIPNVTAYADIDRFFGLEQVGDIATICIVYPLAIGGNGFTYIRVTKIAATPTGAFPAESSTSQWLKIEAPAGVVLAHDFFDWSTGHTDPQMAIVAAPMSYFTPGIEYVHLATISSHLRDGVWYRSDTRFADVVETDAYDQALATWPANAEPVLNGGVV